MDSIFSSIGKLQLINFNLKIKQGEQIIRLIILFSEKLFQCKLNNFIECFNIAVCKVSKHFSVNVNILFIKCIDQL